MQEAMTKRSISLRIDKNAIMSCGIFFISVLLIYNVIYLCARSFDFTDESFYIININSPSLYHEGSQFGFVYHPLYELLGKDIFIFRVVDFIIFLVLSFTLTVLVMNINLYEIYKKKTNFIILLGISMCAIFQNTMNFTGTWTSWLATPSYNSLNFESLIICMIGVIMTKSRIFFKKIIGNLLVGFGIALCFLAKPTSAFLFFIILMLYWLLFFKNNFSFFLYFFLFLCITIIADAYIIDGSLWKFILRIKNVVDDVNSVNDAHGFKVLIRRIFEVPFFIKSKRHLPISFIVQMSLLPVFSVGLFVYSVVCSLKSSRNIIFCCLFVCTTCFCLLFVFDKFMPVRFSKFISLSMNISILFVIGIGIIMMYVIDYKNIFDINFYKNIPLTLLFFVIPLVYAVGTDFNYFYFSGKASIFWILGGVTLARSTACRKGWNFLLPFVLTIQLILSFSISICKTLPYRQGDNVRKLQTDVPLGGSTLKLSDEFARYIGTARIAASVGGFTAGTPVLDLTGQSSGILYVLEAEVIGRAWIIGGLPYSLNWAVRVLQQRVPREKLLQSWILVEPGGQRSLPGEIFERLGLNFPEDYDLRAEWLVPRSAGNRQKPAKQYLYAPKSHTVTSKDQ